MLLFPNSYIISVIKIRHHTFYARPRCKEIPLCQPLRGRWRNTTSKCMGSYKFVVIPKHIYIKRDQSEIPYILRKAKKHEGVIIPTTA